MARPRVIRLPHGGEVTLKNCTPEDADKVKALLLGDKAEPTQEESAQTEEEPAPPANLSNTAIGTYYDKAAKRWCCAIVKFDPISKAARLTESEVCGEDKFFAEERFKILVVNHDVI